MENIGNVRVERAGKRHLLILNGTLHEVPDSMPNCTHAEQTQKSIAKASRTEQPKFQTEL